MIEWIELLNGARIFAKTELGRIGASLLIVAGTTLIVRLLQSRARLGSETSIDLAHRRRNFVLVKNLVLLTALILVGTIWASKIAGAALSLAAVAGAILIISKEFLSNLLGSAMLAISTPYRVGDFIELDGISGRVLDSDLLVTTIAETLEGHQLTGRTVAMPHSMLLVRPVRNLTATGQYMVNLLKIVVHPNEDLLGHESALLSAAQTVCAPWLEEAERHLKRMESRELLDLPSSDPRVIIQMHSAKDCVLALRYTCKPNDRVKVEQNITRLYLRDRPARTIAILEQA